MHVTRCDVLTLSNGSCSQIAIAEVCSYVGHDCAQPSRRNSAPLGNCLAIFRCPHGYCNQIVNMGNDEPADFRCADWFFTDYGTRVGRKQIEHVPAARHDLDRGIGKLADKGHDRISWNAETQEPSWHRAAPGR